MLELKGNKFKFKFGFKAMLLFESETGKSVSELGDNFTMQTIVELIYAGIKSTGEKIEKDYIIDAIDEDLTLIQTVTKMLNDDIGALFALSSEAKNESNP